MRLVTHFVLWLLRRGEIAAEALPPGPDAGERRHSPWREERFSCVRAARSASYGSLLVFGNRY